MIGLLIIGDEILSSQIQDKNLKYMLRNLAISGYCVSEARIIGDDFKLISDTVKELSIKYEFVITSGGVGPTHDDITLEAIADSFNVLLEMNSTLELLLTEYFKEKINLDILRMAKLPIGAEVIVKESSEWPIVKMENVFILPGVPQIFQKKFDHVLQLLPQVEKYFYSSLYSKVDESEFVVFLRNLQEKYQTTIIGSYPVIDEKEYKTQVTIKSKQKGALLNCYEEMKSFLSSRSWLYKSIEPSFYNPSIK
jgi:molybdenum cofactor synthesis domain-containing protein